MKITARWWVLAVVATVGVVVIAVSGCSQKKHDANMKSEERQGQVNGAVSSGARENEETIPSVAPAGTVPEIWAQIGDERAKLSSAIQNGQLKGVHHLAFGIRDLVIAAADRTASANPTVATKLKGLVEQVRSSASKLDELGDAGNLTGTQAEFDHLEGLLKEIQGATNVQ